MNINLRPLNQYDANYLNVIDLYREAFPGAQHIPSWFLRYKLRKGKAGFSLIYAADTWVGLIYNTAYKDMVFLHFFAVTASNRSIGYGSQVLDLIKQTHVGKRVILNIELLDEQAKNHQQQIKRKAFYEKNGFRSSGFTVKEPKEQLEMLIHGGSISKQEIEAVYKNLFGKILGFIIRPKVIKI